jgi:hypothetical protein
MIVIGDLHLKDKEPYWEYQQKFLRWLNEEFSDRTIVFLGDIFDTSAPTWNVFDTFQRFLRDRWERGVETVIVHGNHELSYQKGSALQPLQEYALIAIDPQETLIDGHKCLILPYLYRDLQETYSNYESDVSYVFTHITPKHLEFYDEGVELSNVKAKAIYHGHIHEESEFESHAVWNKVLGVPLPTKHGEIANPILDILNDASYTAPETFSYETVSFGEFPESSNVILNVIDAPSVAAVMDKYKDYHIRTTGIELKDLSDDVSMVDVEEASNLVGQFSTFATDQENISQELAEFCKSRLARAGVA